jgi:uncharacterized phiE125 gp8 family phage protein
MSVLWGRSLVTSPIELPVSVARLKLAMRYDENGLDSHISDLLEAATGDAEALTNRRFVTQTWDFTRDCFPSCSTMEVPFPPLQSVTSITYIDSNGDSQTLSTDVYVVDTAPEPGEIRLKYNQVWPVTRSDPNAVTVRAVVGYGAASAVPSKFCIAIMQMASHWFRHPEAASSEREVKEVPLSVDRLLTQSRVEAFF